MMVDLTVHNVTKIVDELHGPTGITGNGSFLFVSEADGTIDD